jgi:hypothetical protein
MPPKIRVSNCSKLERRDAIQHNLTLRIQDSNRWLSPFFDDVNICSNRNANYENNSEDQLSLSLRLGGKFLPIFPK